MKYLQQDYYIGLLNATSIYGATHQQPISFQVVTNNKIKDIMLGRGKIEFHSYKHCALASKVQITVLTGYVNISSKEQTLMDILRFYTNCGYMSNVATVIKDLAPECLTSSLAVTAATEPTHSVL